MGGKIQADTHLHTSTQQTGPERTERHERPSSIRTFARHRNLNDRGLQHSSINAVDPVACDALPLSRTWCAIPH